MLNTLYIHIGTHKTGTSAIQRFLALNKALLEQKGFLFPEQSRRAYYKHTDEGVFVTRANQRSFQKLVRLGQKKQKKIIVSSETFSLLENVFDLKPVLAGSTVKIICYLRRQDDLFQSLYNQSVKGGSNDQDISVFQAPYMDYFQLLAPWAECFGQNNMIVRVYEKQQLLNQSLIDDFMDALGLPMTDEYQKLEQDPNPRLPLAALGYMRGINCLLKDRKKARKYKDVIGEFSSKLNHSASQAFVSHSLLSDRQQKEIMDSYRISNELVARTYLGRPDGRLFSAKPAAEQAAAKEEVLSDELFLNMTQHLCRDKSFKIMLLKSLKQDVSGENDFTRTVHSRFLKTLNDVS